MENKKIEDFISKFGTKSTRKSYKTIITKYFEFLDENPDTYIVDIRLMENGDRIKVMDRYESDINKYWQHLMDAEKAPKSIQTYLNCLRVFFKEYRIYIDEVVWSNIRRRGSGTSVATDDIAPTNEELKEILSYTKVKGRALFLLLATSGMRVGEALNLREKDINFSTKPTTIKVPLRKGWRSKNKKPRITFCSDEAAAALKLWINNEREKFLDRAVARTNFPGVTKSLNDPRLFPFNTNTAREMWNRLLNHAELGEIDDNTGIHKMHVHTLRKFYLTNMSKQNRDVAEVLAGHSGYLSNAYERYSEDYLRQEYLKGMKFLNVFGQIVSESDAIKKLREEHEKEIAGLKEQMQTNNIAKKIINNPSFRREMMSLIEPELKKLQQNKQD